MNKYVISLGAIGALSLLAGSAIAETSFAGDNQAPTRLSDVSQQTEVLVVPGTRAEAQALAGSDRVDGQQWYHGRYGLTTDPDDLRRWDEKNGS